MTPPDENERPKAAGRRAAQARPKPVRAATARAGRSKQPAGVPSAGEHGILSSLPSTRPQRPSARRAAAKRTAAAAASRRTTDAGALPRGRAGVTRAAGPPTKQASRPPRAGVTRAAGAAGPSADQTDRKPAQTKRTAAGPAQPEPTPKRRTRKRPVEHAPSPPESPIPRQGFETEDEIEPGTPVNPPTRPELAAAVVELFGELAQGGLTTGGRLLKDALGRLPGV